MESAKVNNKIVVVCSFWRASHMVWSMWCFGFVWSKISNDNDWQNRIRMLPEECVRLLLSIRFGSIATSIQWNGFYLQTFLEKSCPELDGENSRELWFAIHWSRALCGSCQIFAFEFINLSINQFSSYLRMSFLVGFSPCVKRFFTFHSWKWMLRNVWRRWSCVTRIQVDFAEAFPFYDRFTLTWLMRSQFWQMMAAMSYTGIANQFRGNGAFGTWSSTWHTCTLYPRWEASLWASTEIITWLFNK